YQPVGDRRDPGPQHEPEPEPTTPVWTQSLEPKYTHLATGPNGHYYFQLPSQKYQQLVEEFGPPMLLNPEPGGMAVWQRSALQSTPYAIFQRIDLVDEQTFNQFPVPHLGFLYTYVKMKIRMSQLGQVLSLCGDLFYDPIKKTLVIRGMSINYNVALLALV